MTKVFTLYGHQTSIGKIISVPASIIGVIDLRRRAMPMKIAYINDTRLECLKNFFSKTHSLSFCTMKTILQTLFLMQFSYK